MSQELPSLDLDKLVEVLRKEIVDYSLNKAFSVIERYQEHFALHTWLLTYGLLGCVGALTVITLVVMLKK